METNSSCLVIEVCVPPQTVQSMEYIFSYLAVGVGFTAVGNSNGNRGGDHHTGLRRKWAGGAGELISWLLWAGTPQILIQPLGTATDKDRLEINTLAKSQPTPVADVTW